VAFRATIIPSAGSASDPPSRLGFVGTVPQLIVHALGVAFRMMSWSPDDTETPLSIGCPPAQRGVAEEFGPTARFCQ
jgi:hypothetical protein